MMQINNMSQKFVQHRIKGNNDKSVSFQRVLDNTHLRVFANFSANNGWGET